ncbi:hypothetical protein HID58_000941, partial [Brassica napus]
NSTAPPFSRDSGDPKLKVTDFIANSRPKRDEQRNGRLSGFRLFSKKRSSFDVFSVFRRECESLHPSSSFSLLTELLQSSNGMRLVKRIDQVIYLGSNLINILVYASKVFDRLEDEALPLCLKTIGSIGSVLRTRGCLFEIRVLVHGSMVKVRVENLIVESSLVYFYPQCVRYDMMGEKDVISWTAVISTCSRKGHGNKAIIMFIEMLDHGFLPTEFIRSVAWSEEKALRSGRHVHSLVVKKMIKKDVFVGTSLMDMYAKCGEISDCSKVFDGMSNRNTLEKGFGEDAIANSEALLIDPFHCREECQMSLWEVL